MKKCIILKTRYFFNIINRQIYFKGFPENIRATMKGKNYFQKKLLHTVYDLYLKFIDEFSENGKLGYRATSRW